MASNSSAADTEKLSQASLRFNKEACIEVLNYMSAIFHVCHETTRPETAEFEEYLFMVQMLEFQSLGKEKGWYGPNADGAGTKS